MAENDESYFVTKTFLSSSAVCQAVYGFIRSTSSRDVVLGKETSIELVELERNGSLLTVHRQMVGCHIVDLKILPWNARCRSPNEMLHGKDLLVIIANSGTLNFVTFNCSINRFISVFSIRMHCIGFPLTSSHPKLIQVHPSGEAIAVVTDDDFVGLFPVSPSAGDKFILTGTNMVHPALAAASDKSEASRDVISSLVFVTAGSEEQNVNLPGLNLALVVLKKGGQKPEIVTLQYQVDSTCPVLQQVARFVPSGQPWENDPMRLIPFPCGAHMLLIIRADDMILFDLASYMAGQELDRSVVGSVPCDSTILSCAWEMVTGSHALLLVATESQGPIYRLHFLHGSHRPLWWMEISLMESCLEEGGPFTCLLKLHGSFLLALSDSADGHILQLQSNRKYMSVCQIASLAPVHDFVLAEVAGWHRPFLVAACGKKGSLRIVSHGFGASPLIVTAPSSFPGVTSVYPIKLQAGDTHHSLLVLSFLTQTRVLSLGDTIADITEETGFFSPACTVTSGRIAQGYIVQVCSDHIRLCRPFVAGSHSPAVIHTWAPAPGLAAWELNPIKVAAVGEGCVVVAMSRIGLLVMLGLEKNGEDLKLVQLQEWNIPFELSCIQIIPPLDEDKAQVFRLPGQQKSSGAPSRYCLVGTHQPSVALLSLYPGHDLEVLAAMDLRDLPEGASVPESVQLSWQQGLSVSVGLRDGLLARYDLLPGGGQAGSQLQLRFQRVSVRRMGSAPVQLVPLAESLATNLFVFSSQPWLLSFQRGRVIHTPVLIPSCTVATAVSLPGGQQGFIYVRDSRLFLAEMDSSSRSSRVSVVTYPLPAVPTCLVIDPITSNAFVALKANGKSRHDQIQCISLFDGTLQCCQPVDRGSHCTAMTIWDTILGTFLVVASNGRRCGLSLYKVGRAIGIAEAAMAEEKQSEDHSSPMLSPRFQEATDEMSVDEEVEEEAAWSNHNVLPTALKHYMYRELQSDHIACLAVMASWLLVAADNKLLVYKASSVDRKRHRMQRVHMVEIRFEIVSVSVQGLDVAVADRRDGVILYRFCQVKNEFELVSCDPSCRLVVDCAIVDHCTLATVDRAGNFTALQPCRESGFSPERNSKVTANFRMREAGSRLRKGSLTRLLEDDAGDQPSIVCTTLSGSIISFTKIKREEYHLLSAIESQLSSLHRTVPLLGGTSRGKCPDPAASFGVVNGDIVEQFLDLTLDQQRAILLHLFRPMSAMADRELSGRDDDVEDSQGLSEDPIISITLQKIVHFLETLNCS